MTFTPAGAPRFCNEDKTFAIDDEDNDDEDEALTARLIMADRLNDFFAFIGFFS